VSLPPPRGRFPASARVRKRSEFRAVEAKCRRVLTPHFVFLLHARPRPSNQPPRLGITASKRIGDAPTRNRAKRLVREAFRALRERWHSGFDVVVVVRSLEPGATLANVVAEWLRAEPSLLEQMAKARPELKS
jgi:ribonuclease P protein component